MTFITMPGTSGNYVDTESVNLMSADAAHMYQSIAGWRDRAGTVDNEVQADDTTGETFSGKVLQVDVTAAGESSSAQVLSANGANAGEAHPVAAATQYTYSVKARTLSGSLRTMTLQVEYYVGTTFNSSSSVGPAADLAADGSWTTLSGTFTTPASVNGVALRHAGGGAEVEDEQFQFADACLRAGTSSVFVPSLRIVGDLDMRAKAAATDWTAAANQTLIHKAASNNGYSLQITTGGELLGWHGDGTDYNPGTSSGAALSDTVMTELRAAVVEATGVWTYYKNGASFDTDTLGAITAVPDTLTNLLVGAATSTTLLFAGDLEWAEIRDGVGGPVVRRFDAADAYAAHGAVINDSDTWTGSVDGATWIAHTDATLVITPGDEPSSGRLLVLGLL